MDGVPYVAIGYLEGEKSEVVFYDGKSRTMMESAEALRLFKESNCLFGYVRVARD